jgi:PAS domain S-box-containing protein
VTASWVHAENPDEGAVWLMEDVTLARSASIALQESEARFVRLFDQSPMPMGYSSSSDGFGSTVWNDAWFETFGFDRATAQGRSGLELGVWVNPQGRAHRLDRALRGESIHNEEAQLQRADGVIRWVSLSSRSFVEADRTLVVFTYFDVTERRLAQQEVLELNTQLEARVAQRTAELLLVNQELTQTLATLARARDQLVQSEKLAALGSLVTGVAHELNTPIGNCVTAISAFDYRVAEFSEMAQAGLKRSDLQRFLEDSREAADLMIRNVTRAATLISSFKQVAVDQTSSQRRHFSLATAISELLLTLKPMVAKSVCTITSDTQHDAQLDSFPGPLGQILTYLIENAILHGYDEGRTAGSISVETRCVGTEHASITVRDWGRGIPADHMRHLFEPFFTTRLGQGGSGLGLYVVHNITTGVLGGTVEVGSVEGAGATLTITIPLVAPACKRLLDRVVPGV